MTFQLWQPSYLINRDLLPHSGKQQMKTKGVLEDLFYFVGGFLLPFFLVNLAQYNLLHTVQVQYMYSRSALRQIMLDIVSIYCH